MPVASSRPLSCLSPVSSLAVGGTETRGEEAKTYKTGNDEGIERLHDPPSLLKKSVVESGDDVSLLMIYPRVWTFRQASLWQTFSLLFCSSCVNPPSVLCVTALGEPAGWERAASVDAEEKIGNLGSLGLGRKRRHENRCRAAEQISRLCTLTLTRQC